MLVIHGVYQWRRRVVGFRNDFCLACRAMRLAIEVRAWRVFHLYWIPVLPLGAWSHWQCRTCGQRPDERQQTGRIFKVLGAGLLVLFILTLLQVPQTPFVWVILAGLVVALGFTIRSIVRHVPEPSRKLALVSVPPYAEWGCPLCGGELLHSPSWRCSRCDARRAVAEP